MDEQSKLSPEALAKLKEAANAEATAQLEPEPPQLQKIIIPVKLFCPHCGARHIDSARNGEVKWHRRAHTTHRCQSCSKDWDVFVSGAPD